MSRSGDQYLFEFAAAGKYLASWVCSDENRSALAEAVNKAIDKYEKQRIERVHTCGVPFPQPAPLPAIAGENTTQRVPAVFLSVQAQDSAVSVVTQKMASAVADAATTVLNYGRLFCATVTDKILSNSVDKFKEKFPVVNAENASLAFMYIGQLSNGWEPENHHGMGRASLSTLILVAVLDVAVLDAFESRFVTKEDRHDVDPVDEFVDVDWKSNVKGDITPGLPKLREFLTCYHSKKGIDPLVFPWQAKQIFLAFAATEPVAYLAQPQQLRQSSVRP